jgi:CRP-like cAMP-binding protein
VPLQDAPLCERHDDHSRRLGGAAFFLIESGEVTVSVRGEERARLGRGDAFGELAMIDEARAPRP